MSTDPQQPSDGIAPDEISTPAGLTSELEKEAAETGASTGDDKPVAKAKS